MAYGRRARARGSPPRAADRWRNAINAMRSKFPNDVSEKTGEGVGWPRQTLPLRVFPPALSLQRHSVAALKVWSDLALRTYKRSGKKIMDARASVHHLPNKLAPLRRGFCFQWPAVCGSGGREAKMERKG
jgi:hypothetical protein